MNIFVDTISELYEKGKSVLENAKKICKIYH